MQHIIDTFVQELTKVRPLSGQVMHYIHAHYLVPHDELPRFFAEEMPRLEEYEMDLIFSPMFTPTLDEQAVFSPLVDEETITDEELEVIIQSLTQQQLTASFLLLDEKTVLTMTLPEVNIRRYVRLMNLTTPPTRTVAELIEETIPSEEQHRVKALVRNALWRNPLQEEMLMAYLKTMARRNNFALQKFEYFVRFVRSHSTVDIYRLSELLPQTVETTRGELRNLEMGGKRFMDSHIEWLHGGVKDKRDVDDARLEAKQVELKLYEELESDVKYIVEELSGEIPLNTLRRRT
jgi:hypothetical protein